jgi:hypothetical protein
MVKVRKIIDNGMIKNRLVIIVQSLPKKIQGIKIIIPARNKPKRTSVIIYPPGH